MSSPLGSLVRTLRDQKGWTQEELADKARISVRTIQWIESGKTKKPQPENLRKLAEVPGIDVTVLQEASRQSMVAAEPQYLGSATSADTLAAPSEVLEPTPASPNRRKLTHLTLIGVAMVASLLIGVFVLLIAPQLSGNTSKPVYLAGRILCVDNQPVVGVWVKAVRGPEGMASLRDPNSNGSEATFIYIFRGDAYDLHVGCGGSGQHWNNIYYTETGSGTVHDQTFHYFHCYDTPLAVGFGSCDLTA